MNIHTLDFQDAPAGFDQSETLYNCQIADLGNGRQAIIGLDIDTQKASLAINTEDDGWAESSDTNDWPHLDRAFGRKEWQIFLAEWQAGAIEDMGDEE